MRDEFIPEALEEENSNCPSCQARLAMDGALVEFHKRIEAYALALFQANHPSLFLEFLDVFAALTELRSNLHQTVVAFRAEWVGTLVLYYAITHYSLQDNRVRKPVMAHDGYWEEAARCYELLGESFAKFETSHEHLARRAREVLVLAPSKTTAFFDENASAPLSELWPGLRGTVTAYRESMEPWLQTQWQGAFDILGLQS